MGLVANAEARAALLERVKGILVEPKAEWPKIEAEPATIGSIYSGYVVYLAAVPVLCTLIGSLIFGHGFAGRRRQHGRAQIRRPCNRPWQGRGEAQ
jgi:hypothetical protein